MIDVEGVRSIFSNPFEFLLFSEIWTTPDEQFEAIPCSIFAVKLRKCFADYKTSRLLSISTEEKRGDDDWFLFRGEVFL